MLLIVWAVGSATALWAGPPVTSAMSTDDLMRLVGVRDFLAGQGWFDHVQWRLDAPAGVSMHWSRLADVPIAALVLALSPVFGRATAEVLTAALWPLILLLPLLALSGLIARRLAGGIAGLIAIVLVATSAPALQHFRPGALDHHGLQILLLLASVYGLLAANHARHANRPPALAGLAAALSLAIGLEMLPAIAALVAAVGLRWLMDGRAAAGITSAFATSFAAACAVLPLVAVPAPGALACDAFSIAWATLAVVGGMSLALLATCSRWLPNFASRLGAGALTTAVTLAVFGLLFPKCLADPYGQLDARLSGTWLAHVNEAQSFAALAATRPELLVPIYGPILLALGLWGAILLRGNAIERTAWLPLSLPFTALAALSLWQVRGGASANLVAQILIAAGMVRWLGAGIDQHGIRMLATIVLVSTPTWVAAGEALGSVLRTLDPSRPTVVWKGPGDCRNPAGMTRVAALPPGQVLAFIDLGPTLLYATPHSVIAAPYHRNVAGNGAALAAWLGDDAAVRRVLKEKRIDYVAFCPGAPERMNYERAAPQGLAARLMRDQTPKYLMLLPNASDSALRIFRVRR